MFRLQVTKPSSNPPQPQPSPSPSPGPAQQPIPEVGQNFRSKLIGTQTLNNFYKL